MFVVGVIRRTLLSSMAREDSPDDREKQGIWPTYLRLDLSLAFMDEEVRVSVMFLGQYDSSHYSINIFLFVIL